MPSRLTFDDIKKTLWLIRPDLRQAFAGDEERFEQWLVFNGASEYRALAELETSVPTELLTEPAPEARPELRPMLTRLMKAIWSMRPDLQQSFDLSTVEGQQALVWWYFIHGLRELKITRFLTDIQRLQLNEPDPNLPVTGFVPVTRFMTALWHHRPALQPICDLNEPEGREAFIAWYFTVGLAEVGLDDVLSDEQARGLLAPAPEEPRIARILWLIRQADPEIRERFADPADEDFLAWAVSYDAMERYPVLRHLIERAGYRSAASTTTRVRAAAVERPFGVNLIGYARGQFGIGEDVRMAACACEAARIPFSIYNVEPGREVCQGDDSVLKHVSESLPYAINIFCTTGIETARFAAEQGSKLFDGRRSIGYWPWELPEWPAAWHHAYNLVDEVWASSRFTYDAFARSCPKPVRHMPMAVTVDRTAGLGRRDFGLPEGRFLFIFAFDVLSSPARKNPQACVSAFRQAFPRGDEPVGLVVKTMRATQDNAAWQALRAEAKADGRIFVVNGTLGRAELLDLYRACDCFVSLHRSEGFGRGLAEAMLLGKPVITTGYSGNMDFTLPGTAALVDHRLRRVGEEDYHFGGGQTWAEPDIAHAAWWMRRLVSNPDLRERLAAGGQRLSRNTYLPEIVGAHYAAVLAA